MALVLDLIYIVQAAMVTLNGHLCSIAARAFPALDLVRPLTFCMFKCMGGWVGHFIFFLE